VKKKKDDDDERPPPAPKVATSMKGLLASVKIDASAKKPVAAPPIAKKAPPPKKIAPPPTSAPARPSDTLRGHERTAYFDAMAGVRVIGARPGASPPRATQLKLPPAPAAPETREADRAARARLAALVSGGVHFEIRREDDWVAGVRRDTPRGVLDRLASAEPSAAIDLHGARASDVDASIAKFLRQSQKRGVQRVRVVHGKGLHSDAGGPVLREAVVDAITKGVAAAQVVAFVTAPEAQGGSGALLIELVR
jgi:DNA-nicking Smr family endonuclease